MKKVLSAILLCFLFVFSTKHVYAVLPKVTTQSATDITISSATGNGSLVSPGSFSVNFNGSNQYLSLKRNFGFPIYRPNPGYSISLWVRGPANQISKTVYGEKGSSTPAIFLIRTDDVSSSKLRLFIRNDSGNTILNGLVSSGSVFDDKWHHVVWVDNNGAANLYIDGVKDKTNFNYTPSGYFSFITSIVASKDGASQFFTGSVDDFRVFNSLLTSQNITDLFNHKIDVAVDSLKGSWQFDEGSGAKVDDSSGNGNTGTLVNNPVWASDSWNVISETGVVWSYNNSPSLSDNIGKSTGVVLSGNFAAPITSLISGTIYHYRAYAVNSYGIEYGNETTFTTISVPLTPTPTLTPVPTSASSSSTDNSSPQSIANDSSNSTQSSDNSSPIVNLVQAAVKKQTISYNTSFDGCITYTVKQGDTLWAIASAILGDGLKSTQIKNENENLYPSLNNSNDLHAGWELNINCVSEKSILALETSTSELQTKFNVFIKVKDLQKKPLTGVKVLIHSFQKEAITDNNGIASFSDMEKGSHTITLSYGNDQKNESINLSSNNETIVLAFQMKKTGLWQLKYLPIAVFIVLCVGISFFCIAKKKGMFMKKLN